MRDQSDAVLYVGKAKSLRKRLNSYRVANPDRLPRRHLRLLRAVVRIELEQCADETAALTRESELLRSLKPRFNRAGTWPGTPRYLGWRLTGSGLEMAVAGAQVENWQWQGPMGAGAIWLRAALLRLVWCVVHSDLGLEHLPAGWSRCCRTELATIPQRANGPAVLAESCCQLSALFTGRVDEFASWIREGTAMRRRKFELALVETDLETVAQLIRPRPDKPL